MKLTIRPVTPDLWPALENLFGKWGASNGCWCMYWRLGGAYRGQARGKQSDVTKDREARPLAGFARFRRRFASGLVPAHAARGTAVA